MNQKEKSAKSKEIIIEAYITEAAINGELYSASLNGLCKKYEISKGKMYHHFSSKEELADECIQYICDKTIEDFTKFKLSPELSIEENFHNYYECRINYWMSNPYQYLLLKHCNSSFSESEKSKALEIRKIIGEHQRRIFTDAFNIAKLDIKKETDEIFQITTVIYNYLFISSMYKIVLDVLNNDKNSALEKKQQLLKLHSTLIETMLYGILK